MVVVVITLVGMLWGIDIGRGFSAAWHLGLEYVNMLRLLTRRPERPRPTPRLAATEQVDLIKTIESLFSISSNVSPTFPTNFKLVTDVGPNKSFQDRQPEEIELLARPTAAVEHRPTQGQPLPAQGLRDEPQDPDEIVTVFVECENRASTSRV